MSGNGNTPTATTLQQKITTIGGASATTPANAGELVQKRWTKSAELAKLAAKSVSEKKMSETGAGVTDVGRLGDNPINDKNAIAVGEYNKKQPSVGEESAAEVSRVSSLTQTLQEKSNDSLKPIIRPRKKPSSSRPSSSAATLQIQKKIENLERRSFLGTWSYNLSKKAVSKEISTDLKNTGLPSSVSTSEMSSSVSQTSEGRSLPSKATSLNSNSEGNTTTAVPAAASQQPYYLEILPSETKLRTEFSKTLSIEVPKEAESSSPSTPSTPQSALPDLTFHSTKSEILTRSKRLHSSKCREVWTLPTKGPSQHTKHPEKDILGGAEEEVVISLPQLVEDHWKKFPLVVRLMKGIADEQFSKSFLDLHFLKRTKVIDVCDSMSQHFFIPHNSPIKLGVIYCPGVKNENYYFEKALDIIQAPDMPKVVTCTRKVKGKDEKSSLSQNEVLIIMEVIRGLHSYSKLQKKPKLKVFSFAEKKEKVLPGDAAGKFTTDPKMAQFFIPEILEYIPNSFPLSARLFLENHKEQPLPDSLTKSPITILNTIIEESVIGVVKEEMSQSTTLSKKNMKNLVELPVVPDILVSVIPEDQIQLNTIEVLYADTETMWKYFVDPADKIPMCSRLQVSGGSPLQSMLSALCQAGEEGRGCALEAPPLVRKDLSAIQESPNKNAYQVLIDGVATANQYMQPRKSFSSSNSSFDTTRSNSTTTTTTEDSDIGGKSIDLEQDLNAFEKVMKSKRDMMREEPSDPHNNNLRLIRRVEAVETRVAAAAPQATINRLTRRIEALESRPVQKERKESRGDKAEIEELKHVTDTIQVNFKLLEEDMKQIKLQLAEMIDEIRSKKTADNQAKLDSQIKLEKQHNVALLKSMDSNQVLMLLDQLGLSRYKAVFSEEVINGEILAECTESILMEDLDIREPSHCSRLMEVIQGNPSTKVLLESIKQNS